ncbi:MAG: MFS transporter [bacterium]|nr:MFS transporter [bacterium]
MFDLVRRRSFGALTLSQFLGAFNDNAFKQLVLLFVVSRLGAHPVDWVADSAFAERGQSLPTMLFALPFVIFGATTGSLADRCSKSAIIKVANVLEILVMLVALGALYVKSYDLLLITIFAMGTQSALFGPSKYGSLKELVGPADLSGANALIQMTTMIAVLLGIMLGSAFSEDFRDALWIPGLAYVAFATVGMLVSLRIEPLPAADPKRKIEWNVFAEIARHVRATGGDRPLILSLVASAFFYLVASTLLLIVNAYGEYLGLRGKSIGALNAMTVIGIAVGSVAAGRISRDRVESGLVPLGLLGLGGSLLLVLAAPDSVGLLRVALLSAGVAAGLFSIPIRVLIQTRPRDEVRGAILGLSEVLDFLGILVASAFYYVLSSVLGLSPPQMFAVMAVVVFAFTFVSLFYTAEFAVRLVLLMTVRVFYRVRTAGLDKLPKSGGALLVANHVSFVDAVLIGAASPRPVHFMMYRPFFDVPLIGWFARRMGAIPVSSRDSREQKAAALTAAGRRVADGDLVCIFAEGAITRSGAITTFASGVERIARQTDGSPIIPVALDRLWGSIFSFAGGRFFWKLPKRIPYPVDLTFGEPLEASARAGEVRLAIQECIAERRSERRGRRGSLAWRFLYTARLHARRPAIVDAGGACLSYRELLGRSLALREVLEPLLGSGRNVAVLLPPSAAGATVNVTLALLGRVSVNLNYGLANAALEAPIARAEIDTLITSRAALEALGRTSPLGAASTIYVEDLATAIGTSQRLRAGLLAWMPAAWLANRCAPRHAADEVATILFSSGSSGDPKGVQLTHANILSNVQSLLQVLAIGPGDAMLGVLPFFHSFGFTVTIWGTLLSGAKSVYVPNPLDAKGVGEICGRERVTILLATPTFYAAYLRRCTEEQLAHVRMALSGAQKLSDDLAEKWRAKFGHELHEGYGCTELSPVVCVNLPGVEGEDPRQAGAKRGTVGRALPGVAVRVVDVDSGQVRDSDEDGLVEVKGPNVMLGYLGEPEATRAALKGGWYVTGDIGHIDRDAFLVITDRQSRFSKIGGEMVPHGKVESALREALARHGDEASLAVTAIEDERRGEELVVLHTQMDVAAEALLADLRAGPLPALFHPRARNFIEIAELPLLGSGKLDLVGLKRLAREHISGSA